MSVQLHNVLDDGELEEIQITGQIKDLLNSEMVVLLVDHPKKLIYIWKGENARVRRKFIAARKSQDLRGSLGLTFKVDSIDQGGEPPEFLNLIGGTVAMAPEISEFIPTEAPSSPKPISQPLMPPKPAEFTPVEPVQPQPVIKPAIVQPPIQPVTQPPPKPAVIKPAPVAEPTAPTQPIQTSSASSSIQNLPVEDGVKQIIAIIDQKSIPPNYDREIVVIGPYVFSIVESKKTFLGQERVERKWELFADLPEGEFLAKDYTARMIVNDGRILAVELLKSSTGVILTGAEIESFKIKFKK